MRIYSIYLVQLGGGANNLRKTTYILNEKLSLVMRFIFNLKN